MGLACWNENDQEVRILIRTFPVSIGYTCECLTILGNSGSKLFLCRILGFIWENACNEMVQGYASEKTRIFLELLIWFGFCYLSSAFEF